MHGDAPAGPVFAIQDLTVAFATPDGPVEAVRGVSLAVGAGECLAVVGESGSGKSQTFLAAIGLLPENGDAEGSVRFQGEEVLNLPRKELDAFRGRRVAMIFQDPLSALTPHLTIGEQLRETLRHHLKLNAREAQRRALEWLEKVRIPDAESRLQQYPHELSGGMRQRAMIAMAMCTSPELLIADEPTTALDATVQAQALDLIADLQKETGAAIILITHDMGVVARMADQVCVMQAGRIVETGAASAIFGFPREAYTQSLLRAVPRIDGPQRPDPAPGADMIVSADNLQVHFPVRVPEGVFGRKKILRAVDGVSFKVRAGETLGVVGESGSGKSTLARAVLRLNPLADGTVTFLGQEISAAEGEELRKARRDLQIVFQDPLASLDPRVTIGASIAEPLRTFQPHMRRAEREAEVLAMMGRVGLVAELLNRYPHELSGGQNQRVGIARAMILKPKLVICDEAVSALDVSIRSQIVSLLIALQDEFKSAMIFISHDLATVREISHTLLVLYLGATVEEGAAAAIYGDPRHPYTKALLAAALPPDPVLARDRPRAPALGDIPSPLDTRSSLRFLPSKMIDDPDAVQHRPALLEAAPGHWVAEFDALPPAAGQRPAAA